MSSSNLSPPPGPTLLFCPADRPERFAKAFASADSVILDLEDAVDPARAAEARAIVADSRLNPHRTIVRVHPVGDPELPKDLAVLHDSSVTTIMVPKVESPAGLSELGLRIIALCETPAGILNAGLIAAERTVIGLMWGAEDLIAAIGGTSSRRDSGQYSDVARFARSFVLLSAAANGKPAIDSVFLDLNDITGLEYETDDAFRSGFYAKACIHPKQVPTIRAAFTPTRDQVRWAEEVLRRSAEGRGVFAFDGRMIDAPLLQQARRVLARSLGPSS